MRVTAFALSLLAFAGSHAMAAECSVTVDSTDSMTFDTQAIQVPKGCAQFTVKLTHSGSLAKEVMGHNWVLSKADDVSAIATDGMSGSIQQSYLKAGDTRVLAHTKIIGAGETDSVTFDVAKLDPAGEYAFFCSFPGHSAMMRGTLSLAN
jgi:azurin